MAKKKKSSLGFKGYFTLAILILMGITFASTSVILMIGMIPTFVAIFIDTSKAKLKPLTVGAMNLAGCFPFILEMWIDGIHDVSTALSKVSEPRTLVIIYMAAAIGYLIDWAMTGIVASISYQNGRARLKEIQKIQNQLIERWGPEVRGELQLDEYGFPVDPEAAQALKEAHQEKQKSTEES